MANKGINKVILIGNLGQAPEVRPTQDGRSVVHAGLATSDLRRTPDGERQEHTEWHRLVFFNRLAEIARNYLRKGSRVYIEGSLRTQQWTGRDGSERQTTEIVVREMRMLDGARSTPNTDPVETRDPYGLTDTGPGDGDPYGDVPF